MRLPTYTVSRPFWFAISRVFPLACILGGVGFLYFGITTLRLSYESESWPTVAGVVLRSTVLQQQESNQLSLFNLDLVYQYEVAGKRYLGSRLGFASTESADPPPLIALTQKYPRGKEVTVHYQPSNPSMAVLEAGSDFVFFISPAMGLLTLIFGLLAVWLFPKIFVAEPAAL